MLTKREKQVIGLLMHGMSGPDIAQQLAVAPTTVKTHFKNIYDKLNFSSRLEVMVWAYRSDRERLEARISRLQNQLDRRP